MKKLYSFIVALLFGTAAYAQSQSVPAGMVGYDAAFEKRDDQVVTDFKADLSNLRLGKQDMVVITPYMVSSDGFQTSACAPVVVAGNKRFKAIRRTEYFGRNPLDPKPQAIIRYKKNKRLGEVAFSTPMPYESWMRDASFYVHERWSGCANCAVRQNDILQGDVLPQPFEPQYRVAYVVPPVEPVKQRSEAFVSRINYEVNKHTLLRNYKNNAEVLDEVDRIMSELVRNEDLTVTNFTVTGYASPEGNPNSNLTLSRNRAEAFLDYLKTNYGWNVTSVHSEGKGEDWDGLYKAVETSHIADRDKVLSIIRDTPDVNRRKQLLRNLSGGSTYKLLLAEYYPPLRRNEYEISYVARAFDVNEAREIIHTKPQLLSLNEMFLVADSYPKGSAEFKNVFDIAARMYPGNPYAVINTAALEIESGAYDLAIDRLKNLSEPDALNNIGVAYLYKGDVSAAESYLRRAAEAGSVDGAYNLDQLMQFLSDY